MTLGSFPDPIGRWSDVTAVSVLNGRLVQKLWDLFQLEWVWIWNNAFVKLQWESRITYIATLTMLVLWLEQAATSLEVCCRMIAMLYVTAFSLTYQLYVSCYVEWPKRVFIDFIEILVCVVTTAWDLWRLLMFPAFQNSRKCAQELKNLMGINMYVPLLSNEVPSQCSLLSCQHSCYCSM